MQGINVDGECLVGPMSNLSTLCTFPPKLNGPVCVEKEGFKETGVEVWSGR